MRDKNKKDFIDFYTSNLDAVFRFCYLKTSDAELAKDLAQQSFMKVWQYVLAKDDQMNIPALVYTIARNQIIDWYRRKKEISLETLVEQGFNIASDADTTREARLHSTMKVLEEIDESDRELIILRYVNNLKPKDIAIIVEEEVNVVSVRIHRAKKKLQTLIQEKGYELF